MADFMDYLTELEVWCIY